jgi:hypothetical protein
MLNLLLPCPHAPACLPTCPACPVRGTPLRPVAATRRKEELILIELASRIIPLMFLRFNSSIGNQRSLIPYSFLLLPRMFLRGPSSGSNIPSPAASRPARLPPPAPILIGFFLGAESQFHRGTSCPAFACPRPAPRRGEGDSGWGSTFSFLPSYPSLITQLPDYLLPLLFLSFGQGACLPEFIAYNMTPRHPARLAFKPAGKVPVWGKTPFGGKAASIPDCTLYGGYAFGIIARLKPETGDCRRSSNGRATAL